MAAWRQSHDMQWNGNRKMCEGFKRARTSYHAHARKHRKHTKENIDLNSHCVQFACTNKYVLYTATSLVYLALGPWLLVLGFWPLIYFAFGSCFLIQLGSWAQAIQCTLGRGPQRAREALDTNPDPSKSKMEWYSQFIDASSVNQTDPLAFTGTNSNFNAHTICCSALLNGFRMARTKFVKSDKQVPVVYQMNIRLRSIFPSALQTFKGSYQLSAENDWAENCSYHIMLLHSTAQTQCRPHNIRLTGSTECLELVQMQTLQQELPADVFDPWVHCLFDQEARLWSVREFVQHLRCQQRLEIWKYGNWEIKKHGMQKSHNRSLKTKIHSACTLSARI